MAYRRGTAVKAGFNAHTNTPWATGAGVAVGAGDALEIIPSEMPKVATELILDEAARGTPFRIGPTPGTKSFGAAPDAYFGYNNNAQRLLAHWWGADAVTGPTEVSTYSHLLTYSEVNEDIFGTWAHHDGLELFDAAMAKIVAHQITFAKNQKTLIKPVIMCRQLLRDDTGPNTDLATFEAAVTLPTQAATRYLLLSSNQFTVRINAFSGGALSSSDDMCVTGATMNFQRLIEDDALFDSCGGRFIQQPLGADSLISGSLTFGKDSTIAQYGWQEDATELKMTIECDSGAIIPSATAITWKYTWSFPLITLSSEGVPDFTKRGLFGKTFNWTAGGAESNPTGMAFATPRLVIIDNTSTAHQL